ncbi:MAG: hypothetical protein LC112_08995 [Flavobacteriales bacterium]|nr:hypothetical protein [Flavobacteriales bacterium]
MKFLLIFLFSFSLILTSCDDPKKDNQLKEREKSLQIKEQEFAAKEQDYELLKAMRDSLEQISDTAIALKIPANILGKWNGKMICTDSNCSENVIGDQRNDIWEFSEDGVKITNKSGGERIYTAKYNGSEIKLSSDNNISAITLQVSDDRIGRMKGIRELSGNNCLSKFSIDLEKIKN